MTTRPRTPGRRRSTGTVSPSDGIPLDVLRQAFVHNSSSESSHLSSSPESSSATPPSSAERAVAAETWPSPNNADSAIPETISSRPPSTSPTTTSLAGVDVRTPSDQGRSTQHGVGRETQTLQEQEAGPEMDARGAWWLCIGRWVFTRNWFQSMLGISSLVVTMLSLFIYGLRSYEMAKWSERNDLLQMCAGLIQVDPMAF